MAKKSPQRTPTTAAFSLISNQKLQQMYLAMLKCRILDSHIQPFGRSSSSKGKEAVLVASTIDLRSEDAVIDSGGGVVTSFLKGLPLSSFLPNLNKSRGKIPAAKRKVPTSEVVESAIVTGIASAHLARSRESIAVAFPSTAQVCRCSRRSSLLHHAEAVGHL